MDAPTRHRRGAGERWSERLPAAYFTRIVLPLWFDPPLARDSGSVRITGRDRRGERCYCHFICHFDAPRRLAAGRAAAGSTAPAIGSRELFAWRLHSGRWFVCVADLPADSRAVRLRYLTRSTAPESVCLDGENDE